MSILEQELERMERERLRAEKYPDDGYYWNDRGLYVEPVYKSEYNNSCGEIKLQDIKTRIFPEKEEETKKENDMKHVDTKSTQSALLGSLQEGSKLAGASVANRRLVALVRAWLGKNYPEFFKSGLGEMLEPVLIPAIVHFVASNVHSLPQRQKVQKVAEYAMTSASKDQLEPLINSLVPLFKDLGDLSELAD